jgi:tripeptidyl-peptidase-1
MYTVDEHFELKKERMKMKNMMLVALLLSLAATNGLAVNTDKTIKAPDLSGKWQHSTMDYNPESTRMTVVLVLKQTNLSKLERLVLDVSTPSSKNYGKHWTADEVNALTRPSEATISTVYSWLRVNKLAGSTHAIQGASAFKIHAPVRDIERAFKTTVGMVTDGSRVKPRAGDYVLPAVLTNHVDAVFGMHGLPLPKRARIEAFPREPFPVTPAVIQKTYNISGAKGSGDKTNRQAVGEYQGENFNPKDNVKFFQQYVKGASPEDANIYKFVGTDQQQFSSTEPALDVEYVMGVAPGILTEYWGYQQHDFCADLLEFTAKILDTQDAPSVFSISYGWTDKLSKLGCTTYEVKAVDVNLQKLGLRGISMIIASQDNGAACGPYLCYASWPSTSPYATSVGATRFIDQDSSKPEMATDQFGSGGGFSTRFNRSNATSWQEDMVKHYLSNAKGLPPARLFPREGRAVPDVSALGEGYQVIIHGNLNPSVGGTSAATPVFAAIVSLINEARGEVGKPKLGWLNPFLYANPQAFNDITVGTNKIGRGGQPLQNGYNCAVGWDPVTGLGTPKFGELMSAALQ